MKIAHVRERNAPAGSPWRLAAAHGPAPDPVRWLDVEEARLSLDAEDPRRRHNSVLFRQPITTLDAHLARGLRVEALAEIVEACAGLEGGDAILASRGVRLVSVTDRTTALAVGVEAGILAGRARDEVEAYFVDPAAWHRRRGFEWAAGDD